MTLVPSIFDVVLDKAYYMYRCFLIQDKVIIKVVVITRVAVIEKGDIVVAFIYIYIIFDENIKQDSPPIARFIDYFLT
jgi:hypothetical protein